MTLDDLSNWLRVLPEQLVPKPDELQLAAEAQVRRIKERTAAGVDVNQAPFTPTKPGNRPLQGSGEMLTAIEVQADDSSARVFFADAEMEKIAAVHNNGSKHVPQRRFFGVSEIDKSQIVSDLKNSVFKRVKG